MKRTALVLEGGSLRCFFSCGVTDFLVKEQIHFDGIFGVSSGALTGVNLAANQPGRTADINLTFVNDKRYLGVRNLIFHRSIFNFDFLFGEVSRELSPFDYETFENSPTRFCAVATDCRTGTPLYFDKENCDDIFAALRASASMPLLAPMVLVNGIPCLDGGVSVSIPYQKAIDEGYEKIIVVTTREHGYRKELISPAMSKIYLRAYRKYPQLVRAILNVPHRYGKELDEIDRLEAQGRVFVIRPPKPVTVSRTEKDTEKLRALYKEGEEEMKKQLSRLRDYLGEA